MAREKEGYRDMLSFLLNERGAPNLLSRSKAANVIGCSRTTIGNLIANGTLTVDTLTNKILIGSVARYLCG